MRASARVVASLGAIEMELFKVENQHVGLVEGWLSDPDNARWLDFGGGVQQISASFIKVMAMKKSNLLMLFSIDEARTPIGVVALSEISAFKTANLWYLLGDKAHAGGGHTKRAVAMLTRIGFHDLGLNCVTAWSVVGNTASERILASAGFRAAGKLRSVHLLDGAPQDRIVYDILPSELPDASGG